ncbi:HNH endonuclease (plasmid) [Sinorhizobium meliloti]
MYVYGEWPDRLIDHRNGDTGDNRLANLRAADRSQNGANSRVSRNKATGYKGAYLEARTGKWMAQISPKGKRLTIGRFDTAEAAHAAYMAKAREVFGDFARAG